MYLLLSKQGLQNWNIYRSTWFCGTVHKIPTAVWHGALKEYDSDNGRINVTTYCDINHVPCSKRVIKLQIPPERTTTLCCSTNSGRAVNYQVPTSVPCDSLVDVYLWAVFIFVMENWHFNKGKKENMHLSMLSLLFLSRCWTKLIFTSELW